MKTFEWSINDRNGKPVLTGETTIENQSNLYVALIEKIEDDNDIMISSHHGLTVKEK